MSSIGAPFNEPFTTFVQKAPAAGPIGSGDLLALVQNNRTRQISALQIGGGFANVTAIAPGVTYVVKAADTCIGIVTVAGVTTNIAVPAIGTAGRYLEFADVGGFADTAPIVIAGSLFDNGQSSVSISWKYGVIGLRWYTNFWKLV